MFSLARTAWRYAEDARPRMALIYALLVVANIIVAFQPVVLAQIINTAQAEWPEAMRKALMWSGAYAALQRFLIFMAPRGDRKAAGLYRLQ